MNGSVQYICGAIDRLVAIDNFTMVIHEDEITYTHVTETHAKWVYPKMIGEFGVTNSDVPRDAFTKTKTTKDAKRTGKFVLSFATLLFHIPTV
jgi:hypothetical protein